MARRAGSLMASAPGTVSTKISDGLRERVLWAEGHGDGEPSKTLIARCQNTVNGHPTWKMYCGEPTNGIVRGKNEPPRYVYLDDRACFNVWNAHAYTKEELTSFWSFDFDTAGNIRTKRPNRGSPAYLNDGCLEYAKGPMRGNKKGYEFSGQPAEAHVPPRPVKVEAAKVDIKPTARISLSGALPPPPASPSLYVTPDRSASASPSTTGTITPAGIPLGDTTSTYSSRQRWTGENDPVSNARIKYEPNTPNYYVSGPVDGTLKPLAMTQKAMQGSPYWDVPSAGFRKNPRSMPGDLSYLLKNRKRGFITEAFDDNDNNNNNDINPVENNKDIDHTVKRVKVGGGRISEESAVE
jgi:hypothetical protein